MGRRGMLRLAGAAAAGLAAGTGIVSAESSLPHSIVFDGTGSRGKASYEFEVTEAVEPDPDTGPLESQDQIKGTAVKGKVGPGDTDGYRFNGDLTHLSVSSDAAVSLAFDDPANTLEILTEDWADFSYEFTATSKIVREFDNGNLSAEEGNDTVVENADGTWTATGSTGGGDGDTYHYAGDIVDFSPMDADTNGFSLQVNGESITTYELTGEEPATQDTTRHHLEILTDADADFSYEFTASGAIELDKDNGDLSAEDYSDSVVDNGDGTWTATGSTGGGYGDSYYVEGSVTEFAPMDADAHGFSLRWDGEAVSTYDLVGEEEPTRHHLEFLTDADADFSYEFTASGAIELDKDNGDLSAEDYSDSVVDNGDGTWTATGSTGGGYGDSYYVDGSVIDFTPMDADAHGFSLRWDGEAVSTYELVGGMSLEILTDDDADVSYEFTASGPIELDENNGTLSAESGSDSVVDNGDGTWTATGSTGGGDGDSYHVWGSVTEFTPMDADANGFSLRWGGQAITTYELTGEEPPEGDTTVVEGGPIGGGDGYEATVDPSLADVTVSTAGDLERALDNASSGDLVYVDGSADIYWGSRRVVIPKGVTLASDRGIDGAPGARIYTDQETEMFGARDDVRVTGLRIKGKYDGWVDDTSADGEAIEVNGSNVEVDNCELWGHAYTAIQQKSSGWSHYHHCDIHDNARKGVGYGVGVLDGEALVEWCRFENNRHSIGASGDVSYEVRYCWHQGREAGAHVFDVHKPGGVDISVHHNTVEATDHVWKSKTVPAVAVRGAPSTGAEIYSNWFYNPDEPLASPDGWSEEGIIQVDVNEWTNVNFQDNHYGTSEPAPDCGHPR